MSKVKQSNGVIKVIVGIVLLMGIVAAIGCIAFFTNNFTEDFSTFYVEVNGEKVASSAGGYIVGCEENIVINVKDANPNKQDKGYIVSVIPKAGIDFEFTVDDETKSFADEKDFTNAFEITKDGNAVTLNAKGNLEYILKAQYPDKTIRYDLGAIDSEEDMFSLVIKNYDEATVTINFRVPNTVYKVTLDPEEIVF